MRMLNLFAHFDKTVLGGVWGGMAQAVAGGLGLAYFSSTAPYHLILELLGTNFFCAQAQYLRHKPGKFWGKPGKFRACRASRANYWSNSGVPGG